MGVCVVAGGREGGLRLETCGRMGRDLQPSFFLLFCLSPLTHLMCSFHLHANQMKCEKKKKNQIVISDTLSFCLCVCVLV